MLRNHQIDGRFKEPLKDQLLLNEIDRSIYDKIGGKIKEEKKNIEAQLEGPKNKLSNPSEFIQKALKICSNLSNFWASADYDSKIRLQEILFPQGIFYDKEIADYRNHKRQRDNRANSLAFK